MRQLTARGAASLALALAPAAPASAQGLADVVLCETTHDQLVRLSDTNDDGDYLDFNENTVLYTDGMGGINFSSPRAMAMRVENGVPVAYWVDTNQDAVFRGEDLNSDGTINLGEETKFRDSASLDGSSSPDGIALTADGAVWWTSDFGFNGIMRLEDLNADGDANDAGEQVRMVDGSTPIMVATDAGPALTPEAGLTFHDFFKITRDGDGVVAWSDAVSAALRFEDLDSDGDVTGAGENRLYLNPGGDNPNFPQNVDWANGLLRDLEVDDGMGGTLGWAWLTHWTTRNENGVDVLYCATGTSTLAAFAVNKNGEGLNGLVFRCVDQNLDGDVQDAGEVNLFYDGSTTSFDPFLMSKIIGLDATSDGVYVGDLPGGVPGVHRLVDLNGDGDAMDAGEQDVLLYDWALYGTKDPFFIGSPFTQDIGVIDAGLWEDGANNFTVTGTGCGGLNLAVPEIFGEGQAKIGNSTFSIGVRNTPAGIPAVVMLGGSTSLWFGLPLPLDLGPIFNLQGCFLYQDAIVSVGTVTSGVGPTGGVAQIPISVPPDLTLVGAMLPLQWYVVDVFQLPIPPIGLTPLGEVEIQ